MSETYTRSGDWQLNIRGDGVPFVENTRGGKVLLDETVKEILETVNGQTFEELDKEKRISRPLLETLLSVFTRIGVLRRERSTSAGDKGAFAGGKDAPSEIPVESRPPLETEALVSLVIVNYNGDDHLPGLSASIGRQSYPHTEVVVVDNASKDNSSQWVKANHPDFRLIELKRNIGFPAAVNTGILAAKGDYVVILNNDIELDEHAVYELVKAALAAEKNRDGKWSAIAPKMKFYNNRAFINAVGNSLYPVSWGSDNYIGHVDFGRFDHVAETFSACFGAVLLNPESIKHIGLLDPRYTFYYEDMDWSFRAQALGYPILTAPASVFYHKFGASMSMKSQSFKFRYIVGNRLYFVLKNLEKATIRRFLPGYVLEDIKSTLIYLKRGSLSLVFAYMRGYFRFALSLPGLFFKRRKLRNRRVVTDDAAIFARVAPLNLTLMDGGVPKLDISSLRTNYAGAGTAGPYSASGVGPLSSFFEPIKGGCATPIKGGCATDIVVQRLRPPRKNGQAAEKMYLEYAFEAPRDGTYDIHLLGVFRNGGGAALYLDGKLLNGVDTASTDKKIHGLAMNTVAARGVFISRGRHFLEPARRNHIHAVVLRPTKEVKG